LIVDIVDELHESLERLGHCAIERLQRRAVRPCRQDSGEISHGVCEFEKWSGLTPSLVDQPRHGGDLALIEAQEGTSRHLGVLQRRDVDLRIGDERFHQAQVEIADIHRRRHGRDEVGHAYHRLKRGSASAF